MIIKIKNNQRNSVWKQTVTSSNVTDRWKVCRILNAISRKLIKPQENEYKQFRNIRKAKRNKRQMEVQEQKSSRSTTETTTRQ